MEKELDTRTITTNSGNNIDANTINSGNSVAYNNGAIKNNTVNDSTPCTTGSGKHGEGTDLFSCEVEEIYDLFLNFKTTEHANSYRYFQSRLRTSLTSISVMLALTTVGQAIMAYLTTLHANVPYVFKPMALFAFAVMLLGLVIYGVKLTDHYNNYKSTFFTPDTAKNMENMFIIGLSVYSNIRLVLRTQQGECIGANFIDQLICNPLHSMNLLPPDTFVGLSILPMMFASVFRTADWNVILFSWILTIATMLLCTYLFHESKLVVLILQVYFPCSLIVLFESRRQSLAIFLMNQKLQFLLSENSRIAKQHATELKHLIGNVAHDLKTPLSAFQSGSDMIQNTVKDIFNCINREGLKVTEPIYESLDLIKNTTNLIASINSFMIMSINRCLDYTKTTNGMKLVPKNSTITLQEALFIPMTCTMDLQSSNTVIKILDIPANICSHIITDKQWLQENLLCLLSNASKYSHNGNVAVCLSLMRVKELPYRSFNKLKMLEEEMDEEVLLFEVEDDGIGIASEVMVNLFNPFEQAQRLAGGTGLGLYSLGKRLEALEGYYGVCDRKDGSQGTLMWFAIPYKPDEAYALASKASMVRQRSVSESELKISSSTGLTDTTKDTQTLKATLSRSYSNDKLIVDVDEAKAPREALLLKVRVRNKPLKFLLVEDSPTIAKMTVTMLRRLGHTIDLADNGLVAVEKVTGSHKRSSSSRSNSVSALTPPPLQLPNTYDIILMDLQMPVMDGLEATKRIRRFEEKEPVKSDRSDRNSDESHTAFDNNNASTTTATSRNIIIGLSANSDAETIEEAYNAGVDAFMSKPFIIATFYENYNKILMEKNKYG